MYYAFSLMQFLGPISFYIFTGYKYTLLLDIGRKMNVNKTFRRLLGHLLNFLCAFNLRLVSTG